MKLKVNWKIFFLSFFAVFFTALLGSFLTYNGVNSDWYQFIKPSITPPNFVFPIAWTILFVMIFFSFYFSLMSAKEKGKLKVEIIFMLNLFLNIFWTLLFFFLKEPKYAFIEIIFLWLSIVSMIYVTRKINKKAMWLLVPYLLWVTFAGLLNYLGAFIVR